MSEKEEFAGEYPEEFAGVSEHVLLNPNFDWISSDAPSSVSSISPHREAKDSTKFSKSLRDKLPTKKNSSSNSKDDSSSSDHIWGSNRSRFNNRRTEKLRSEPEESKKSKIVNNEAMDVSKPDKGLSGTVAQYSENESMKIVPSSSDAKEKNSDKIDDGCVMRSSRESLGSSHFESIDGIIGTSTANWRNHGGYAVPTSNSARMTKSQKEARERILISQRHLLQGTNSKDGYSPRRVVNYSRPESFDIN